MLVGGGFAVLYTTITIAFRQYTIFSQSTAFLLLIIITIFSVILSLVYDKKELAIFSQLGGYASPFMVSSGDGNYVVLFSYILILNAGLLVLSYYKRWNILNILAFVFTVIIYTGWLLNTFDRLENPPYLRAFLFASLFYIAFFLVSIINNLKERAPFNAAEIGLILSNNLFYFLTGLAILHNYQGGIYKGLFTVLLGVYNFGWVFYLFHRQKVDKNLLYLLIGLVMSYVSIAVPIQLNGHSITLFWSAEAVLLLWLAQTSGIKLLKAGHMVVLVLAILSLFMDWDNIYWEQSNNINIIINKIFLTGLIVIASVAFSKYLLAKEPEEQFVPMLIGVSDYKKILVVTLFILVYFIPFLELCHQLNIYYSSTAFRHTVYGVFNYTYLFSLLFFVRKYQWKKTFHILFYISLISFFAYIVYYNTMMLYTREAYFMDKTVTLGNFFIHLLAFPFMAGIIFLLYRERNNLLPGRNILLKLFLWYILLIIVFITSAELDNFMLLTGGADINTYDHILKISHRVGYPILWGIIALFLIIWGIKAKIKDFRIMSLSLFALILLKLFLLDVWKMNEGGRIAAFIFLGIILLVVSFLYQKLKKLFLEDPSNTTQDIE